MLLMPLITLLQVAADAPAQNAAHPPVLRSADAVFGYEAYPPAALRKGEAGIVSVEVAVSVQGRVTDCAVTERSGSTILDEGTCAVITKRGRFDPATDAAGRAVVGAYRIGVSWGVEAKQPNVNFAIPLQVAALPADYRRPLKATLLFDAAGRLSDCRVTISSGSAAADRAACRYLRPQLVVTPPRSAPGVTAVAVRYVTTSLTTGSVAPVAPQP